MSSFISRFLRNGTGATVLGLLLHLSTHSAALATASVNASCKFIPGDAGWPSKSKWDTLNATVGGRLIATVPIAHVCHDPTFEKASCDVLKVEWGYAELQVPQPAEILAPYFHNQSCDPYTAESKPCTLGNYAQYSLNVSTPEDAVAGLKFARANNIRLVIKNTGHDLLGKSTGKGSLALWTHNLNTMNIITNYSKPYYVGPAVKVGAGVMGGEASIFVGKFGYRLVTGGCPTVGLAGGYTQGGGFSLMSGYYGLGADNVLEWDVITAQGDRLIATPLQNQDLFWALSGGGGGTYGVVISMTVRLFEDGPIGRAGFLITSEATGSLDSFWDAVDTYHSHLEPIIDTDGISVTYLLGNGTLDVLAFTAPDKTAAEVTHVLTPMLNAFAAHGLSESSIAYTAAEADSYQSHWTATLEPVMTNVSSNSITSGRFITRDNMANNVAGIGQALRNITANGDFQLLCSSFNANGLTAKVAANAVQPTWRNSLASCVVSGVWDWNIPFEDMVKRQEELTTTTTPIFEAVTPGSATYLNEGNFQQPDWQQVFYESNYGKLKAIKKVHDPADLFYATTAVGSEAWMADEQGRLCRS